MKHLVLFTMKSCPHCTEFKNMLKENEVLFHDYDIDEHKEEYDMFLEITGSEFVPAFMVVNEGDGETKADCYYPEKHYDSLEEAVELAKKVII